MKTKLLRLAGGLAVVLAGHTVYGVSGYVSLIPNGSVNSCCNCHQACSPPALNPFGSAFSSNGHVWNAALARLDSDGDGFTNGQELGDPTGSGTPISGASVSLPGDATSKPTLTPPNISISSPANGGSFPAPFTGPITAASTASAGAIVAVQFFSGTTLLGTDTAAPYSQAVNLAAGGYSFTARAIDYLGASNTSAAVSITVNTAAVAPTITSAPPTGTGRVGVPYNFTSTATGTAPITFSASGLPPGLAISSSGVISGTPTTAGTFPGTITAANGTLPNATQGFSIVITAAPVAPTITSAPPTGTGRVGVPYSFTSTATGTAPITFSASGLPPGLTISSSGTISGTPTTAGTFPGTITAANGTLPNATQGFSIVITAAPVAPTITSAPPTGTGMVGVPYNFTSTATGTAPITFSASGLPPGLTISSSGTISGTPTTVGTFPGTITAANGTLPNATQGFSIVISQTPVAPTITSVPPTGTGMVGVPYNFTSTATGTAPITFSASGLPPGLTISSSGIISGTPTTAGTFPGTITAANGTLPNATQGFSIVISPVGVSISLTSPTNGSTFLEPATFSLIASATPVGSIARVNFFQGSTLLGSAATTPYVFNVLNLVAGSYTFTAQAVDTAGNPTTSAAVNVTVTPTTPPQTGPATVTVTAPDPNAAEAGLDPGTFQVARTGPTTNDLSVFFLLGGTAVNGQDYQLLPNSVTIATGQSTASITVTPILDTDVPVEISDTVILELVPAPTTEPPYTIGTPSNAVVTIAEATGNATNRAPVVRIIAPRNGARFRSGSNILLSAVASDPDGSVASVEFFAGTTDLGPGTLVPGGGDDGGTRSIYMFRWTQVHSGQYVLTAVATDNAGATTISAPVKITVSRSGGGGGDDGGGGGSFGSPDSSGTRHR